MLFYRFSHFLLALLRIALPFISRLFVVVNSDKFHTKFMQHWDTSIKTWQNRVEASDDKIVYYIGFVLHNRFCRFYVPGEAVV